MLAKSYIINRSWLVSSRRVHSSFQHGLRVKSIYPKDRMTNIAFSHDTSFAHLDVRRHNIRLFQSTAKTPMMVEENEQSDKTKENEIFQELQQLSKQIIEHDKFYYTPGLQPIIADDEYDALARREAEICQQYPQLLEQLEMLSPLGGKATRFGGRVGPVIFPTNEETNKKEVDKFKRLHHMEGSPMMSLDNAMNEDEMIKWIDRLKRRMQEYYETSMEENEDTLNENYMNKAIEIIAEPKMDGLSLSLRYELVNRNGENHYELKWGATRGDGTKGEEVTDAVIEICEAQNSTIPQKISLPKQKDDASNPPPSIIEIRGEIILPRSAFDAFTSTSSQIFTNARNAASGILRRTKNVSDTEFKSLRNSLKFYAYDIALPTGTKTSSASQKSLFGSNAIDLRLFLSDAGFTIPTPMALSVIPVKFEDFGNSSDYNTTNFNAVVDYHRDLISSRDTFDFEIDGAVYKVSDFVEREVLGTSSRAPKWAVAYKFPSMTGITSIRGMEIQVGRTGALTPVAILDPVDIGGVVVSRASLHNFQYAKSILGGNEKGIRAGESVIVARAGDVIPQVLGQVTTATNSSDSGEYESPEEINGSNEDETEWISLDPPLECPACGSSVIYDIIDNPRPKKNKKSKELSNLENVTRNEGKVLRCGGPHLLCRPRCVGALTHAFSRSALDVSGLSEARISDFIDANILTQPSDMFRILEEKLDDTTINSTLSNSTDHNGTEYKSMKEVISELPGWGPKSAQNLQNSVQNVVTNGVTLDRYIYSLGIRHVGSHTAKLIASAYGSASTFLEAMTHASTDNNFNNSFVELVGNEEVEGVKGIGPVVISSLFSFSRDEVLVKAAKDLIEVLHIRDDTSTIKSNDSSTSLNDQESFLLLDGKTIVFTGSIQGMTRTEAQTFAKKMGAKSTPGSVSKSTNIVVEGEKGGKKVENAKKMGIEVMPSSTFLEMVESIKDKI